MHILLRNHIKTFVPWLENVIIVIIIPAAVNSFNKYTNMTRILCHFRTQQYFFYGIPAQIVLITSLDLLGDADELLLEIIFAAGVA